MATNKRVKRKRSDAPIKPLPKPPSKPLPSPSQNNNNNNKNKNAQNNNNKEQHTNTYQTKLNTIQLSSTSSQLSAIRDNIDHNDANSSSDHESNIMSPNDGTDSESEESSSPSATHSNKFKKKKGGGKFSKFNIKLSLSQADEYDHSSARVSVTDNDEDNQHTIEENAEDDNDEIINGTHRNKESDISVVYHDSETDVDSNATMSPRKPGHKSSVVIHEEMPSKPYHKGTIVIHETKASDEDEEDEEEEEEEEEYDVIKEEETRDGNGTSDEDDDYQSIGLDLAEIEQITEEIATQQTPSISYTQVSIPMDGMLEMALRKPSVDDDLYDGNNNGPSHGYSQTVDRFGDNDITSRSRPNSRVHRTGTLENNNSNSNKPREQLIKHNIAPNKNDKSLENMKRKITQKRHRETRSLLISSSPTPPNKHKPDTFGGLQLQQVNEIKIKEHKYSKINHEEHDMKLTEKEKEMIYKTMKPPKKNPRHHRVNSLPPKKPLPSLQENGSTATSTNDNNNKQEITPKPQPISINANNKKNKKERPRFMSRSAQNTPVSPTKSATQRILDSPFATIDNDEMDIISPITPLETDVTSKSFKQQQQQYSKTPHAMGRNHNNNKMDGNRTKFNYKSAINTSQVQSPLSEQSAVDSPLPGTSILQYSQSQKIRNGSNDEIANINMTPKSEYSDIPQSDDDGTINVYDNIQFQHNPEDEMGINPQTHFRKNRNIYQSQPNIGSRANRNNMRHSSGNFMQEKNNGNNNMLKRRNQSQHQKMFKNPHKKQIGNSFGNMSPNGNNNMNRRRPNMNLMNNGNKKSKNVSFNGVHGMHQNRNNRNNGKNPAMYVTPNNNKKRVTFNGFDGMHNDNNKPKKKPQQNGYAYRKQGGNRNAINKIKHQMAMKLKAKQAQKAKNKMPVISSDAPKLPNSTGNGDNSPSNNSGGSITPTIDQLHANNKIKTISPNGHNRAQSSNEQFKAQFDQFPKPRNPKRRVRQNIFAVEPANAMKLKEQTPKYDHTTGKNINQNQPKQIPNINGNDDNTKKQRNKVPKFDLDGNEQNNDKSIDDDNGSSDSQTQSDSSSEESSGESSESPEPVHTKRHQKRRSNFVIKNMRGAQSPRFGARRTPKHTPKRRNKGRPSPKDEPPKLDMVETGIVKKINGMTRSDSFKMKENQNVNDIIKDNEEMEFDDPKKFDINMMKQKSQSAVKFRFDSQDVNEHNDNLASGIYTKLRGQRTKTPQFMPSVEMRRNEMMKKRGGNNKLKNQRRLQTARFSNQNDKFNGFDMENMKNNSKSSRKFNNNQKNQKNKANKMKQNKMKQNNNDAPDRIHRTKHTSWTYADYKRMRKAEEEEKEKNDISAITWIRGEVIGKGAFGTVYKGMYKKSRKLIAIKEFKFTFKNKQRTLTEFEKETKIMKKLKHANIVEFYEYRVDNNNRLIYLIMEYVPGNSIEHIYMNKGSFSEAMIQKYVYQLIMGLNYAHQKKIIHRDIKGKNILIDNKGVVKIADFGSAILQEKDSANKENAYSMDFEATPLWAAPECLDGIGEYDSKIDIWSTGCCIIEMATAAKPWKECNFKSPFQALHHIGSTDDTPEWPKSLSIKCQTFISKCLQRDPDKRYNTKQLLKHPFLTLAQNNSYQVDQRIW